MTTLATPPQGFHMRPATLDDLDTIFHITQTQQLADYDESDLTLDELRAALQSQKTLMHVVIAPDGQMVASGEVKTNLSGTVPIPLVSVLPEYQGRGIGTALLHVLEEQELARRAAAALEAPARFFTQVSGRNTAAHRVLEKSGYTFNSAFQIMELGMSEAPPAPAALEGIAVRRFVAGQDEQAVYQADEEAFLDERGKTPRTFEVWSRRLQMDQPHFDPTLWYVAWDGDQIAGTAMSEAVEGRGELLHLGVRRPWRRRGLGMALLLGTLRDFYTRGISTIRLNVDAQSLTNAHLLYARAGFQVINAFWNYEKLLPAAVASKGPGVIE